MVLRASWGFFGPLLGAGGLLESLWALQIDPKGLPNSDLLRLGALFGFLFSLLASEDGL